MQKGHDQALNGPMATWAHIPGPTSPWAYDGLCALGPMGLWAQARGLGIKSCTAALGAVAVLICAVTLTQIAIE